MQDFRITLFPKGRPRNWHLTLTESAGSLEDARKQAEKRATKLTGMTYVSIRAKEGIAGV